MARYKNVTTGVVVEVADDLVLGSEWGPEGGTAAKSESPDKSWKVDELKAYASEKSIDLGAATKKEDILAAISAASEGSGSGE